MKMRVYLIAAPEDEAEAEKLAAYLKRFGAHVRTEYGKFAYPPAQQGEVTLALWSRNAMMSSRQMLLTNRAIDAWAEGQLVMARLEHGLNPRGLSDLDMIDLTFEAAREHRYGDVMKALRALEAAHRPSGTVIPDPTDASAPSVDEAEGTPKEQASAASPGEEIDEHREHVPGKRFGNLELDTDQALNGASEGRPADGKLSKRRPATTANRMAGREVPDASSGSGNGQIVGLIVLLVAVAFGAAVWQTALSWQVAAMVGGSVLAAVVVIGIIVSSLSRSERASAPSRKTASARPSEAPSAEPVAASVAGPAPTAQTPAETHAVFVSYSHQNAETVLPLVETVEARGLSIWIDKDEMRAGQSWAGQIVRAIKSAEQFCLMCSEQSFASDHVRREVYLADKYGKAMVPVRLDSAEMPEDIEYFLAGRQWVDLTSLSEDDRAAIVHGALSLASD